MKDSVSTDTAELGGQSGGPDHTSSLQSNPPPPHDDEQEQLSATHIW